MQHECPPVQHLCQMQLVPHAQPPDGGRAAAVCPGDEGAAEGEQDPADLTFVPQEHFARECSALIGLVQADLRRMEAARSRRAHNPASAAAHSTSALLSCFAARRSEMCCAQGLPCSAVRIVGLSACTGSLDPLCTCRSAPAAGERDAAQAERAQAEAAQAEAELLERRLTGEHLERVLEIAEGIDVGYSLLSGQDSLWGELGDHGLEDEPESQQSDEEWLL